jgi:hypothetical protein
MNKIAKYAGYAWAFPVTLWGLVYVLLFWMLGWYTWYRRAGDGLVWLVNAKKAPRWLLSMWKNWAGHAVGNVVVMNQDPEAKPQTLTHELRHVEQVMRLGIFHPFAYAVCYLAIKFGCPGSDPYYSCWAEIDARRAAGQIVDVEGALKKLREKAAAGQIVLAPTTDAEKK